MPTSSRGSSPKGRWPSLDRPLVAIVVAYLILGLGYTLVVPAYEAPDEPAHFTYTWILNQTGS